MDRLLRDAIAIDDAINIAFTEPPAVFMGSRVVVMSARPGRIKLDLPVNLAHPRHYAIKTTPVFTELKVRLTEEIRVEVQKAAGLWVEPVA